MTTAAQLITRVLHPLRDANQEMFTDAMLIDYMNQAIVDLCARERLIREVSSATTASGTLALPEELLATRWVRDPNGVEVGWMDESTFFDYVANFPDWDSEHPIATIYDNAVQLWPTPPNGETWTIGFYALPATLTADTDTFPLRRLWEEKVVRYIRSECWYALGDVPMADRERQFYEEGLRPAEAITDHQVPGKVNLSREPNVFDVHPESIHMGG